MLNFVSLTIKIKKNLMHLIFSWKANCNLDAPISLSLLFDELSYDTVENFMISDSSNDDRSLL